MPSHEPTAVSSPKIGLQAPPAQFDLPGLEEGILQLWQANDVEGRSLQQGAAAARPPPVRRLRTQV